MRAGTVEVQFQGGAVGEHLAITPDLHQTDWIASPLFARSDCRSQERKGEKEAADTDVRNQARGDCPAEHTWIRGFFC